MKEDRFKRVFAENPIGMVMIGSDLRCLKANRAYCRMSGYAQKDLKRMLITDLIHPDDRTDSKNSLDRLIKSDIPYVQFEKRFLRKNGAFMWSGVTVFYPACDADSPLYLIAMVEDATERKRVESMAEAVNTMDNVGYIFSGIRHEIGNPLSSVKMALSVMRNKIEGGCTKELIDRYLDRAMTEISRMEHLLTALKSFNIYEIPDMKDMDMAAFVRGLRHLMDGFIKKGLKITVNIQPAARRAFADPRALQQVALNIITNAVDALKDRARPKIDIKVMKIGSRVLMHIEDNGCGMTPEQLRGAFRPFYTTKHGGTGLGLMLARKMITRMNGVIEITSEQGAGTSVDIFIPEGSSGQ